MPSVEALLEQALAAHRLGQAAAARALYLRVLDERPMAGPVWRLLGQATAADGAFWDAAHALIRAIILVPNDAAAFSALAGIGLELDAAIFAMHTAQKAIYLSPTDGPAWNNLGNAKRRQHQMADAQSALCIAICLEPHNRMAWLNLGVLWRGLDQPVRAALAYQRALDIEPNWPLAGINLANTCQIMGDRQRAADILTRLYHRTGQAAYDLKRALLLPVVVQSIDDIETARDKLDQTITRLNQSQLHLTDPLTEIGQTAFYLAYHDRSDLHLQSRLADLYIKACPGLIDTAPHIDRWRRPLSKRIRIAIVSEFMHAHTIGRLNLGLVQNLDRKRFELILVRPERASDDVRRALDHHADHVLRLPDSLGAARSSLRELAADIIYYPDIGMAPLSYFLAFARMAPVQAVGWGHPDTTGIPNLDLFISCAAMEPDDSHTHYRETLCALAGSTISYARPAPVARLTRADFGLPESGTFYLCPQTPQKLHPDFDAAIGDILRNVPDSFLVLVHGMDAFVGAALTGRMKRVIPDCAGRVIMLPSMPGARYRALMALCDVMLDPFHYSGGHTTLEAMAADTPLVTWPGRFMRGRHTAGFLSLAGLGDWISGDQQLYRQRAIALGRDKDLRQDLRRQMAEHASLLFDRPQDIDPIADCFEQAVIKAAQSR
jgi:predicted O-linked N-acetylglucosamine transferase (SPINDLY family)